MPIDEILQRVMADGRRRRRRTAAVVLVIATIAPAGAFAAAQGSDGDGRTQVVSEAGSSTTSTTSSTAAEPPETSATGTPTSVAPSTTTSAAVHRPEVIHVTQHTAGPVRAEVGDRIVVDLVPDGTGPAAYGPTNTWDPTVLRLVLPAGTEDHDGEAHGAFDVVGVGETEIYSSEPCNPPPGAVCAGDLRTAWSVPVQVVGPG